MAQNTQQSQRHARHPNPVTTATYDDGKKHDVLEKLKRNEIQRQATITYIKRVLCSQSPKSGPLADGDINAKPLEELLPPLTSSNEVDVQLYAIIAVILHQFVQDHRERRGDLAGQVAGIAFDGEADLAVRGEHRLLHDAGPTVAAR